ncbi:hypothetical protein MMC10_008094 [Thelotrema lepadinum]|nr:hypothetical protein [Thelotrema lepadinum]
MPLNHFAFHVPQSKLDGVVSFLVDSLQHMGFKEFMRPMPGLVAMGETTPWLWVSSLNPKFEEGNPQKCFHLAFTAENFEQVKQFHAAALKAGGTCNGPPGPRPQFGPNYYAAFVLDPQCGINFEVVCKEVA